MHGSEFCVECGQSLAPGWRLFASRNLCRDCRHRNGKPNSVKLFMGLAAVAVLAFALGRYTRPGPPPLIIQRPANAPLADVPVGFALANNLPSDDSARRDFPAAGSRTIDEPAYICGARTKKGTPCHRHVHFAGERCFQHKGLPAILPLEQLTIKP
jgi:hypothetical protein